MSNYHYNEGSSYNFRPVYATLNETTNYECDHKCTCRDSNERSDKDKMMYNTFVLNQPMVLPSKQNNFLRNNNCQ